MRKLFMFLALVLGVVSCQNHPADFDVSLGNAQEVLINVTLPEGTRADSAQGAITNKIIESSEYTLRYIFQVYSEDKTQKKETMTKYSDESSVSFPVRLIPGRDYRFVVWADIVKESDKADLHYNTTAFPAITLIDNSWVAMDETRDAYTVSQVIEDFGGSENYTLTLKRPFAKLRVITTDTDEWLGIIPKTATVTYQTPHYDTFDALESEASGEVSNVTHNDFTIKDYEASNGKVIFTDYFFAENDIVRFNLSVMMSDNMTVNRSFSTDIPVKRNHLTTIAGQILTEGGNITVNINPNFGGYIEEEFPFDNTIDPNKAIYYTATGKVEKSSWTVDTFGANVISNTWSESTGEGVIVFDSEVTMIGDYAFDYCSGLTSITIPDSITTIGSDAFRDCENLTNIIIPDSVTNIGERTFSGCSSLTSVTIPDSVTTIEYGAFADCNRLTSVIIPDSVTTIGELAFAYCDSLTGVTIGDSVTTIEYGAFADCISLTEFNGKFASEDGRCLIIDGTLNSFAPAGLTEYTIPDSVTTIGDSAFCNCSSLTSVTIPEGVTTIGDSAFYNCSSLTSVYCKAVTPPVGDIFMFLDNAYGRKIYVPMESVVDYQFAHYWINYVDAIIACNFANNVVPTMGDNEILYTNGSTIRPIRPFNTSAFDANIISNSYDDSKGCWVIKFDGDVTNIGERAFYGRSSLTSITIPNSVTTIGELAFAYCDSLTGVTIGDSVTTIEDRAFEHCISLTSIIIPNSVTTIGEDAFRNCSSLTRVFIGDSVTSIGYSAFLECSSLTSVYCKAVTPPAGDSQMFRDNGTGCKIYVPRESVAAYRRAFGGRFIGYDFL